MKTTVINKSLNINQRLLIAKVAFSFLLTEHLISVLIVLVLGCITSYSIERDLRSSFLLERTVINNKRLFEMADNSIPIKSHQGNWKAPLTTFTK